MATRIDIFGQPQNDDFPLDGSSVDPPKEHAEFDCPSDSIIEHQVVRNILIVGKTGVGKSTIANKLLGESMLTVSSSLQGVTRPVDSKDIMNVNRDGIIYNIKLIDTVGVEDREFCHQQFFDNMRNFLQKAPNGIHLVLFVFKNGRLTDEDKKAFKTITSKFGHRILNVLAIVVTCCEGLDEDARAATVEEYKKWTTCVVKKGIFTVGFPNPDTTAQHLQPHYEKSMRVDVEQLQALVSSCKLEVMTLGDFSECDVPLSWGAKVCPKKCLLL